MKKFIIFLVIAVFNFACTSNYEKEMSKNIKNQNASQRINSSQDNNANVFKDLD